VAELDAASVALDGDDRLRINALSADAHHVAAGLLLKLDDQGLAYLAADRSMHAVAAYQGCGALRNAREKSPSSMP
jgi:hypothetical protein